MVRRLPAGRIDGAAGVNFRNYRALPFRLDDSAAACRSSADAVELELDIHRDGGALKEG